jgi:hypothetical protein
MVQDALVMALGTLMLIAAWGTSLNGWVICYAWSLFIYGIGGTLWHVQLHPED